jgi:hypothetical protein
VTQVDDDAGDRLRRLFSGLALAAAALTFVVVVASAYIRHAQTDVHLARVAHRLAATGVLALVIGMLLLAWTQRPVWRREGTLALAALAVALALAVLGLVTPGARLPAIAAGNLLGGYAMLAVLAAAWAAGEKDSLPVGTRRLAAVALALVFVETFLGWARFEAAHVVVAAAVTALGAVAAWRLRSARPRLAAGIAALLAAGIALGFAVEAPGAAVAVAVAHNALAAGLVALLAATTTRAGSDSTFRTADLNSRSPESRVRP